jgi:hypothetical protein
MWKMSLFHKNKIALTYILSFLAILGLVGCDPVDREELMRRSSPDALVDAVLIQANAGATTSYVQEVYIVPARNTPNESNLVFRGDKMDGLKVYWIKPQLLMIQYKEGRIFEFTNFWNSQSVDNFKYEIEIQLTKYSTGNS